VPDDDLGYRVAFINAFRQRGLYPRDVRSLSVESLRWQAPDEQQRQVLAQILPSLAELRRLMVEWDRPPIAGDEEDADEESPPPPPAGAALSLPPPAEEPEVAPGQRRVRLSKDRRAIYNRMRQHAKGFWRVINAAAARVDAGRLGLDLKGLKLEVHSVRPCRRIGPDGQALLDLVVVLTQRKPVYPEEVAKNPDGTTPWEGVSPPPLFMFRGGCTLLIDPEIGEVRYCIVKNIANADRLRRQRDFLTGTAERSALVQELSRAFDDEETAEPFAMVHRALESEHVDG